MKARTFFVAWLMAGLLLARAYAGIDGTMSDKEWFETTNKILVLEYESPLGGREGLQLAQLIGRMALATGGGITNFAVVTLRQTDQHLELTEANVEMLARKQQASVVIWGEFYEQNARIFVTSHLRYVAGNLPKSSGMEDETGFSWNISKLAIPDRPKAHASLPSRQINFAPVEVSRSNLSTLQDLWKRTLTLHSEPNETSPIRGELEVSSPYRVIGSEDDWSEVMTRRGPGWVRLADLSQAKDWSALAGVVLYAESWMQHLTGNAAGAARSFHLYLYRYSASQDAMNKAMAHLIYGYSLMRHVSDWRGALEEFSAAKKLLPNSAAPVNCLALALFEKAASSTADKEEIRFLEKELVSIVTAEMEVDAIQNLQILYQLPGVETYFKDTSDFKQARDTQLGALRDLEAKARQQPGS